MLSMSDDERLIEVLRLLQRECRGRSDVHYRDWSYMLMYHNLPGIVEVMQTLLTSVRFAVANNQRLNLQWWEQNFVPIMHTRYDRNWYDGKADMAFYDAHKKEVYSA